MSLLFEWHGLDKLFYFVSWENFWCITLFSQNDSLKDFSSFSYLFVTNTTQIMLYFCNLLNLQKVYNGAHRVENAVFQNAMWPTQIL